MQSGSFFPNSWTRLYSKWANLSIFQWLAKTEGDKQICRDLKVTGNNVEITDRTDYRIKISTGDVKNGGTQQVTLRI